MTTARQRKICLVHFIVRCGEKQDHRRFDNLRQCVEPSKECRNRYTIRDVAITVTTVGTHWPKMPQLAGKSDMFLSARYWQG